MDNLIKDVILYLPTYLTENKELVDNVTQANSLILDFCDQEIKLEQVLDELSTLNISPDDFRENLDFNLSQRGI